MTIDLSKHAITVKCQTGIGTDEIAFSPVGEGTGLVELSAVAGDEMTWRMMSAEEAHLLGRRIMKLAKAAMRDREAK